MVVGGALLLLVGLLLVVGVLVRGRSGHPEAPPVAVGESSPTDAVFAATVTPTPALEPTVQVTTVPPTPTQRSRTATPTRIAVRHATQVPVVTPTSTNGAPPAATLGRTPTPTLEPTAPSPTPAPTEPLPQGSAVPTGIEDLPRRNEHERAYARYWEVLSRAYLTGDASRLPEVMSGPLLEQTTAEVEGTGFGEEDHGGEARTTGVAVHLETQSLFVLDAATGGQNATLEHRYRFKSFLVDRKTGRTLGVSEPEHTRDQNVLLVRLQGAWKVLDISDAYYPEGEQ